MSKENIIVTGAKEKNLNNISVIIPQNQITTVVGVSGSGKSALVFDTIAAESQRQLNETYSSFIRSRLPHYGKPNVDTISNLAVSIIINQKKLGDNARSTVGTVTDIYSLLRLLFSRAGTPFAGYSAVFSFNNPQGMCKECQGLGVVQEFRLDKLLNMDKSLNEGAIRFPTFYPGSFRWKRYVHTGLFDNDKKLKDYTRPELDTLLYKSGFKPEHPTKEWPSTSLYEGVIPRIKRSFLSRNCQSAALHQKDIEQIVTKKTCPVCMGGRLNSQVLNCKINGKNIADCSNMTITTLIDFLKEFQNPHAKTIIEALLQQLTFAKNVGLGYLTLNRSTSTLSGGESQRIKMIRQLGSSLNGLIYIFDEPSTGLHPADLKRINQLFVQLRDKGNTILIVEHDPDIIQISDYIIEMGPHSGKNGGEVTFMGDYSAFCASSTLTSRCFAMPHVLKAGQRKISDWFHVEKASKFNLHEVSVDVPKGVMTIVTGVAGSGKSTLFGQIFPAYFPDCCIIDQKAVSTNKRSNIATFVDAFDNIRELFARENHVASSWFSFNSKGACPNCKGLGTAELDLAFMESVTDVCEVCNGKRFTEKVLKYTYHKKTINDILALNIDEALGFFNDKSVLKKLTPLKEVGLGYLTLGQPLTTLSGGELQRLKLAVELKEPKPIYVLDEPTTGLHFTDIQILLKVFDELIESGSTLIVIEHNLEMMCQADWIIDLGPGAGSQGGQVLFQGAPEELLKCTSSVTAKCLKEYLTTSNR
ncbi:ATP-binding cassette domain-containing protein [Clostridium sp. C105KSO13]|uniref:ATP-binding cassette domain-containing protein n=1 Tax=Clostridium sp. C105KSO13 TaxID=1776045 RepID=UPI000740691E|nr:excinuclease ABC subunit UvrA [Clostridium sp. C105KSO13]CUX45478.1 UvrABC system protein A [Clostridium sp. C105KSO13]